MKKYKNQKSNKLGTMRHRKFILALLLLIIGGADVWGQTNYVFYNATYGFIYNNNGSVGVKTAFDESCIWVASGSLGNTTTSRNIRSYVDDTKYMRGSGSSPYISLGDQQDNWRGSNNCLRYRQSNTNNYYINYNGSFYVSPSDYSNGFTYYTVSITNAITPTFAISYPTPDAYVGICSYNTKYNC